VRSGRGAIEAVSDGDDFRKGMGAPHRHISVGRVAEVEMTAEVEAGVETEVGVEAKVGVEVEVEDDRGGSVEMELEVG